MPHLIEKYYAPIIFTKKGRYTSVCSLVVVIVVVFVALYVYLILNSMFEHGNVLCMKHESSGYQIRDGQL